MTPGEATPRATALVDAGDIDTVYRDVYLDRARTVLAPVLSLEDSRRLEQERAALAELPLTIARALDNANRSLVLGMSSISNDMRKLLASNAREAAEAIEFFVYRVSRELGSLVAALGGLDALVFTAGIGEHAAPVRARVCEQAGWLGIRLDQAGTLRGGPRISTADSPVSVWVIPNNEELMIARHTLGCARRP